eukprot:3742903-Amphidinium_carterae.1
MTHNTWTFSSDAGTHSTHSRGVWADWLMFKMHHNVANQASSVKQSLSANQKPTLEIPEENFHMQGWLELFPT